MKASFNLGSIKSLVALHVEKVVLGVVCLCSLLLVYGGVAKSGGLDWEPSKLKTEASGAEKHVDTFRELPPDEDDRTVEEIVEDLQKALKICMTPVENPPYEHEKIWVPSPFDQRTKRGLPELFAVEDLRAATGCGAVSMGRANRAADNAARRGAVGQRWVVLTGAIPIAKQQTAFDRAFKDAYKDPKKDTPTYIYYYVERAEVDPSADQGEIKWTPLHTKNALAIQKQWRGRTPEIISKRYLATNMGYPMAFPLPPVTNRKWGPEIAHEPEIPFYQEMEMAPIETEDPEADPTDVPDEPGALGAGRRPGYAGGPGGGMMEMESQMGMGMGMGMGYGGMGLRRQLAAKPVTSQLFRFFDFTVVPGKHYRYRVRLLVSNPNQDVPPEHLAEASYREARFLETEFSDASDLVTIPLDSRLLCVDVKSSINPWVEPSAHMMSIYFDPETGEESAAEHEKINRGQLADFFGIAVEDKSKKAAGSYDMAMGGGEGMEMMEEMMPGGAGGRDRDERDRRRKRPKKDEEIETVDHVTKHILLDVHGGQRLDRDLNSPCSVLLLSPTGQLVVRADLDDQEEFLTYHVPEEEPRKEADEDMMEGYMGGMGMGMEME